MLSNDLENLRTTMLNEDSKMRKTYRFIGRLRDDFKIEHKPVPKYLQYNNGTPHKESENSNKNFKSLP
jgi:hypothetical protein